MHRIMIVDDDAFVSLELSELLTAIGYDVVGMASSGKDGVEMARDVRPDLILMDVILPGEPGGIEAAEEIMSQLDIPVIFITGHTEEEFLHRAKQVEPFGYILKPFQKIQLMATIDIALNKKNLESQLRRSQKRLRQLSTYLIGVQENERKRIALELHDEVGQALSFLKLSIGSISKKLPKDQIELKNECEEISDYILQMVENVRRLSRDLSPRIVEDLGLSSALRWLVENSSQHANIETSIEMDDINSLIPKEVQVALYRIFQEAITNMVKHAKATRVSIAAKKNKAGDIFSFILKDNGVGFDLGEYMGDVSIDRGLGLTAMDERAKILGGSLEISSQVGKGTKITLSVPINKGG
ncbi:MAG: response regulator [Proteobacteria bacterium]|nr:response regulator [Pseudomonadota bacterium]